MDDKRVTLILEGVDRTSAAFGSISRSLEAARRLFTQVGDAAKASADKVHTSFAATGRSLLDLFREIAKGGRGAFKEIEDGANRAGAAMKRLWNGTQGRNAAGQFTSNGLGLGKLLSGGLGLVSGGIGAAISILGTLGSIAGSVFGAVASVASSVLSVIGSIIGAVVNLAATIGGALLSAARTAFGFLLDRARAFFDLLKYGAAAAIAGLSVAFTLFAKTGVDTNLTLQQTGIALTVLTRNASLAVGFLRQLREEAKLSTFEFTDLADWSKKLIGVGFNPDQTLRMVRALGDMAVSLKGPEQGKELMNRLIIALGQINAKGVMQGEEAMQLMEAGLNVRKLVGVPQGVDFGDLAQKGDPRVLAQNAIPKILSGIEATFGGMQQRVARTLPGLWSNIKDTFKDIAADTTSGFVSRLRDAAETLLNFLNSLKGSAAGQAVLSALASAFNTVGDMAVKLANALPTAMRALAGILNSSTVQAFGQAVVRAFLGIVQYAANVVSWLSANWGTLVAYLGALWEWLRGLVGAVLMWIAANWQAIWARAAAFFTTVVKLILGGVAALHSIITDLFGQMNNGQDVIGKLGDAFKQFALEAISALRPLSSLMLAMIGIAGGLVAAVGWGVSAVGTLKGDRKLERRGQGIGQYGDWLAQDWVPRQAQALKAQFDYAEKSIKAFDLHNPLGQLVQRQDILGNAARAAQSAMASVDAKGTLGALGFNAPLGPDGQPLALSPFPSLSPAPRFGKSSVNVNVNVTGRPGSWADEVAEQVRRSLRDWEVSYSGGM